MHSLYRVTFGVWVPNDRPSADDVLKNDPWLNLPVTATTTPAATATSVNLSSCRKNFSRIKTGEDVEDYCTEVDYDAMESDDSYEYDDDKEDDKM